ncbi:hypothetical protein LCGC14_1281980 [marine sediment metagenome]|uniref:Uncharacterized protein n=1 Tax=marine sediment metagenome TaxID=412755 RepID=A0A0F9KWK8_9ZZZZ
MTPTPKAETKAHQHPEAFCLMRYRCEECKRVEVLWNTRNGVTPFILSCKYCGGESSHAPPWQDDKRAPDHVPVYGDRVFVDLTPQRHELLARKSFERMWKRGTLQKAPGFDGLDKDAALVAFLKAELDPDPYGIGENVHDKGQPDIRTIGRDMVWLGHIPKGANAEAIAEILLPQLCNETRGQDLEKTGVAIEAGAGDLAELENLDGRPDAHVIEERKMAERLLVMEEEAREIKVDFGRLGALRAAIESAEEVVIPALEKEHADEIMEDARPVAAIGAAPLLKCAAGVEGPTYVLTRYGADGKVSDVTEAADTDEGRASLATVMLISVDDERAEECYAEAGRIRRGELPLEMIADMERMKRGVLKPILLERGELKPILLEGVGDHGRFYEVEMGDEAKATDALKVGVTDDERAEIEQDIVDWPPKVRRKASEMLDRLVDGMTALAAARPFSKTGKMPTEAELQAVIDDAYEHKPPAVVTIPIRMPRDATPEDIEAQEGPGGCTHAIARADANLIHLQDTGLRVLEVTVRCEECRHRFRFTGLPLAIDPTRPCVNLAGTIATLPVRLGPPDMIKTCERCHKDHDDPSGLICAACAAEVRAENKMLRRVTCKSCGHWATYRASEQDPTKCAHCRSKQIEIIEITEERLPDFTDDLAKFEDHFYSKDDCELRALISHIDREGGDPQLRELATKELDKRSAEAAAADPTEFPDNLDDSGLAEAVEKLEQEGGSA